jgi:hypothetical protein
MKKSAISAVLLAFLMAAPAFAEPQTLYCHSSENSPMYQVGATVVSATQLNDVLVTVGRTNDVPQQTEVTSVNAIDAGADFTRFKLMGVMTLRLPNSLILQGDKAASATLLISDEAVSLNCETHTGL